MTRAVFGKRDRELNERLLLKLTARGLGMSARALSELPEIRCMDTQAGKLKAALELIANNVQFPVELPAFDPSVCQTPMSDKAALELYDEFGCDHQLLYAGGSNGTIWIGVCTDCPLGVFKKPFFVIGTTRDGKAVVKQEYVKFLRQFTEIPDDG